MTTEMTQQAGDELQIIDDQQKFSDDLSEYMDKWGLTTAGFDYHVVAVFGSQSTGKSTLLNRLFGTTFAEMGSGTRRQTTRGIWGARGAGTQAVVLDVEGTDGRERGEDQDFERKSALFSLAVSEVVIVNMWETMVGLYNGANMGLLKTVLEVNLQLFGARGGKTLLYFVIRDHVSAATLDSLAATLRADVERIWAGLGRPEGLETAELGDHFDLAFASLPHKMLQAAEFEEKAKTLRTEFVEGSVFRPEYARGVPADGFAPYAKAVWEKVVSNKDLDLPTQQELLAQYRCDEIAAAALEPFRKALEPLRPRVRDGELVDDLGEVGAAARRAALDAFDGQAARYHADVYRRKRDAFQATLDGDLQALALAQVRTALARAAERFAGSVEAELEEGGDAVDFGAVVAEARAATEGWFGAVVDKLEIPDAAWTLKGDAQGQLRGQLDADLQKLRAREAERAVDSVHRSVEPAVVDAVAEQLNQGDDAMWAAVMAVFDEQAEVADGRLAQRLERAGVEPSADIAQRLHGLLWGSLERAARDETADQMVLLKLRTALEDSFRYDAAGLPRVWGPGDDIDGQFAVAKAHAQRLLPLLSRIDASGSRAVGRPGFFGRAQERRMELLSASRVRELAKRFGREADALFLEAKRSLVATHARVPPWVLVLLVVLGWNEAMVIMFNPLYLVLAAMVAGSAFVLHSLGLWRPALRVAQGAVAVANDHVHGLLVEAVNRTEPRRRRPEEIELEPVTDLSDSSGSSVSPPAVSGNK
ncbi:Dynamin-like GTPase that mediates homotypic ER fusion [Coemansia sp. RSA 552]|nr:Dynamin-like GTPase that mediates homotypic ER fusion [Coemansia sp. RSA 552]